MLYADLAEEQLGVVGRPCYLVGDPAASDQLARVRAVGLHEPEILIPGECDLALGRREAAFGCITELGLCHTD